MTKKMTKKHNFENSDEYKSDFQVMYDIIVKLCEIARTLNRVQVIDQQNRVLSDLVDESHSKMFIMTLSEIRNQVLVMKRAAVTDAEMNKLSIDFARLVINAARTLNEQKQSKMNILNINSTSASASDEQSRNTREVYRSEFNQCLYCREFEHRRMKCFTLQAFIQKSDIHFEENMLYAKRADQDNKRLKLTSKIFQAKAVKLLK